MGAHQLAKYEAARLALAAAHRVDEVKHIRDKAQALSAYARQARDTQMVEWATEIKVRAERRCGELLAEMEKAKGTLKRGTDLPRSNAATTGTRTLDEMGITKDQSSRYQRLAAIPEEHFEAAVETAKAAVGQVTSAHMLRLANELRETRELKSTLARTRRNLDPASKAAEAWRPIELALRGLHDKVSGTTRLPACPPRTRAELTAMWQTISRFFDTHLEQA